MHMGRGPVSHVCKEHRALQSKSNSSGNKQTVCVKPWTTFAAEDLQLSDELTDVRTRCLEQVDPVETEEEAVIAGAAGRRGRRESLLTGRRLLSRVIKVLQN